MEEVGSLASVGEEDLDHLFEEAEQEQHPNQAAAARAAAAEEAFHEDEEEDSLWAGGGLDQADVAAASSEELAAAAFDKAFEAAVEEVGKANGFWAGSMRPTRGAWQPRTVTLGTVSAMRQKCTS